MPDKRQDRRYIRRCETKFSAAGKTFRGFSSDFSAKGLFIRTNHPFTDGTILDIVVHLPDGSLSKLRGEVKRASKTYFGMSIGTPSRSLRNGMGIEIIEKDSGYGHLMRSLLD